MAEETKDPKPGENQDPNKNAFSLEGKTPEQIAQIAKDLASANETLKTEKRELLHETMQRKDKLRKLEEESENRNKEALKSQQKWEDLYKGAEPQVQRLQKIEPVLQEIFDLEIADVPEDMRDIIPDGTVEAKIKWVKSAKQRGVFGKPQNTVTIDPKTGLPVTKPAQSIQSKVTGDKNLPEFVSWAATDPRLTTLNPSEFTLWRQHNRKVGTSIPGYGG